MSQLFNILIIIQIGCSYQTNGLIYLIYSNIKCIFLKAANSHFCVGKNIFFLKWLFEITDDANSQAARVFYQIAFWLVFTIKMIYTSNRNARAFVHFLFQLLFCICMLRQAFISRIFYSCDFERSFCWYRVRKGRQLREVNHCRAGGCGRDKMWRSTSIPHCSDRCSFVKLPADLNGALLLKHREAISNGTAHLIHLRGVPGGWDAPWLMCK